jgi:hypothetical protein
MSKLRQIQGVQHIDSVGRGHIDPAVVYDGVLVLDVAKCER